MNKYILSVFALAAGLVSAQAQTVVPISTARTLPAGSVTVQGTVLNGPELGTIRYIQDATGAVAAYNGSFFSANTVVAGDSIQVTGVCANYNNLAEFGTTGHTATISVVGTAAKMPAPIEFGPAQWANAFNEQYEGQLVKLKRVPTLGSGTGVFAGSTNYTIAGNSALQLRISNVASPLIGTNLPADTFDVIGIMSQFCSSPTSGCTSGYQLLPRVLSDLILSSRPALNGRIVASVIDTNSLNLSLSATNQAVAVLRWGTVPGVYTDSLNSGMQMVDFNFLLQNLSPATVYYVNVTFTNATGSLTTSVFPFVTKSKSSGKITTYFTQSTNPAVSWPNNQATSLSTIVDDTLIAYINRAKESLDIAIYNWNNTSLSNITTAVNAAYSRGVKVRVIADGSTAQIGLQGLAAGIQSINSPQGTSPGGGNYSIMHNKFVVFDANSTNPNDAFVWTGSTNWTAEQINSDYNNVVIFQDQSIARVYRIEFEEMWGSNTLTPGAYFTGTSGTARFGNNKKDNTPHNVKVGNTNVEVYFSPSDATTSHIISTINTTNHSLQTANLVVTRTDIASAIRSTVTALANQSCSAAIVNDTGSTGAPGVFRTLRGGLGTNRAIVKPNRFALFHHKYLIVDSDYPDSDPAVLTGSHNWSTAGETTNDENTVIIHDQSTANKFYQEFSARMIEFGATTYGNNCRYVTETEAPVAVSKNLNVYPNPSSAAFSIALENVHGSAQISVTDMAGRVIISKTTLVAGSLNEQVSITASGLYVVHVTAEGKSYTQKVSVQ